MLFHSNSQTDEAAPTFYWFTIETPAILISICIPAILSLCRFLDALYFKPLASKISSSWPSQSRGTLMTEQYDNAVSSSMASSKSKYVTDSELNASAPNESQSRICLPSQQHGHYSVEVTRWEMQDQSPRRQSTNDAIRVQQDVEVRASPW